MPALSRTAITTRGRGSLAASFLARSAYDCTHTSPSEPRSLLTSLTSASSAMSSSAAGRSGRPLASAARASATRSASSSAAYVRRRFLGGRSASSAPPPLGGSRCAEITSALAAVPTKHGAAAAASRTASRFANEVVSGSWCRETDPASVDDAQFCALATAASAWCGSSQSLMTY